LKDIKNQAPGAICEVTATNVNRTLIINRDKAPFDNADLRRAMSLTLDRKAFIDIITEGKGDIGATMLPAPEGVWGMPTDELQKLPGYDPDVAKNRAEARNLMQQLGYGPDRRLPITVSTRNLPPYRDPAVILIDQLKEIYIDGVLEPVDTTQWYPKIMRKDYTVGLNVTEAGIDDPDQQFYENYVCGSDRNYTGSAIPRSIGWSTGNRWNPTKKSASSWCGRSSADWWRTVPGRSSFTPVARLAGTRRSRA
jgi:peptide/nickel transport system substrate-binding protein